MIKEKLSKIEITCSHRYMTSIQGGLEPKLSPTLAYIIKDLESLIVTYAYYRVNNRLKPAVVLA
jgi:hypothetical protein